MASKKAKVKGQKGGRSASLFTFYFLFLTCGCFALNFPVNAQTIAILTPDKAEKSIGFADKLESQLSDKLRILDGSLSEAAYLSVSPATPFNLASEESKRIGTAIGCDLFILIRAETLRRSSFQKAEYYESYAAVYLVSSRTGRLVFWKLHQFEAAKPERAQKMLEDSIGLLAVEIAENVRSAIKREFAEPNLVAMEEVPDENSPAAKNFRAPIPYRRIKPEYTTRASLYDITATVDMVIDLDEKGTILRTEIARWAGFGLDESVEKTVRDMNWRPAERNGKSLPMRFLVRYNFKKVEKE